MSNKLSAILSEIRPPVQAKFGKYFYITLVFEGQIFVHMTGTLFTLAFIFHQRDLFIGKEYKLQKREIFQADKTIRLSYEVEFN